MTLCINGKTYEAGELVDYVKKLEKEIAELKSEKGCESCTKFDEVQLTKAKEIIRDLMSFPIQLCDCRHTIDFEKTREEAEQFLKDCEVVK